MRLRALALWSCVLAILLAARPAHAWIENHVLGDEARIVIDTAGKALVEHRITLKTNGNVRLRSIVIEGVDRDAVPLDDCYAALAQEAGSSSLASATPLRVEVTRPEDTDGEARPARLHIEVADQKGLRRGTYVLVIRYRTDLAARGLIVRDGAFTRITWHGPRFEDGFDSARTIFVVPAAPTAPRAIEHAETEIQPEPTGEDDDTLPATYLTEVRRGEQLDEIELLRTYTARAESVPWAIRVDPRALDSAAVTVPPGQSSAPALLTALSPTYPARSAHVAAAGLFMLILLLVWLKAREVQALAREARATMPPVVPLPVWARAPLAAACCALGVYLQLMLDKAVAGAFLVVAAAALAAYGIARPDPGASMRGPGRWLTVTEREALSSLPPIGGAWLDVSTRIGKGLFLLCAGVIAAAVWWLVQRALWHGVLVACDGVVLLAVFGTGLARSLPPDMTVEPARFLAKVLRRLRKRRDLGGAHIVPRIRVPTGEIDADELRLVLLPRVPLRGFTAIEMGVTFAIGLGARVAMPEVLLRVVAGSPCEEAVRALARHGHVGRGRKREERVIRFAPRFPTARMTAEIAVALAAAVTDRKGLAAVTKEPVAEQAAA